MKVRYYGIGTDENKYTNDEDYCIKEYGEHPTQEQIKADAEGCLLLLQFELPYGVRFKEGGTEVIEQE
jgi:hypothetical protein